jgi:hypothetical protein
MSSIGSTLALTITSSTRTSSSVHPLLQYDPDALDGAIQLIKLEYLEAHTTTPPLPRNQELPKNAFGRLTGRSILVATSHAWFYQNHPDPHGIKLKIMRQEFFPRLRKRFPHTQIVLFDDWHSCPQWPRFTKEENDRFKKCMDHMNSIYCYCDVVLFVEAPLPKLDMTVFSCDLVPSEHKWLHFIDTIQYLEGDNTKMTIRKNDIVIKMRSVDDDDDELTINVLRQRKEITTISYLKRPYGRPNRTPAEERGWLYAERITVAIRMAAAKPEVFDDVVMSNSLDLIIQICGWSNQLRNSARKEKKHKGSIANQLELFRATLEAMKFTSVGDDKIVNTIMTDLVKRFSKNWKEETVRQKEMSTRSREILLRWGCFSEDYVERAELLCDSGVKNRRSWVLLSVLIGVITPLMLTLPFMLSLEKHGEDPCTHGLTVSSVWLGCIAGFIVVFDLHAMNYAFANITIGGHTMCALVAVSSICVLISILLRSLLGTIVPFEAMFIGCLSFVVGDILYGMIKFIPVKDKRTGQTKRWAIGMTTLNQSLHLFSIFITIHMTTYTQERGFTCLRHIDSISEQGLL